MAGSSGGGGGGGGALEMVSAGLHWSFRMSRQMAPCPLMLQWYILVLNTTCTLDHRFHGPCAGQMHLAAAGKWTQQGCCSDAAAMFRNPCEIYLFSSSQAALMHHRALRIASKNLGWLEGIVCREVDVKKEYAA